MLSTSLDVGTRGQCCCEPGIPRAQGRPDRPLSWIQLLPNNVHLKWAGHPQGPRELGGCRPPTASSDSAGLTPKGPWVT